MSTSSTDRLGWLQALAQRQARGTTDATPALVQATGVGLPELNSSLRNRLQWSQMYNEEVNDLLAPENKKLQVHESREQGVYVAGLREDIVTSAVQA